MNSSERSISIGKLAVAVSLSIFLGEALIMKGLEAFPGLPESCVALLDAGILVLFTLPFVYYFAFMPLERQVTLLKANEVELNRKHRELSDANALNAANEAKYANLFDFAPVGYMLVDHQGLILEINQTGADLLGTSKLTASKKNLTAFLAGDESDHWKDFRRNVSESSTKLDCKLLITRQDGTTFYALLEGLHETAGIETHMRISFTDITQEDFMHLKD